MCRYASTVSNTHTWIGNLNETKRTFDKEVSNMHRTTGRRSAKKSQGVSAEGKVKKRFRKSNARDRSYT